MYCDRGTVQMLDNVAKHSFMVGYCGYYEILCNSHSTVMCRVKDVDNCVTNMSIDWEEFRLWFCDRFYQISPANFK